MAQVQVLVVHQRTASSTSLNTTEVQLCRSEQNLQLTVRKPIKSFQILLGADYGNVISLIMSKAEVLHGAAGWSDARQLTASALLGGSGGSKTHGNLRCYPSSLHHCEC